MFIVDIMREYIAVKEAQKLNIPIFALVDTNSNPNEVDFAIPGNDDASKAIKVILEYVTEAVKEGISARDAEKDKAADEKEEKEEKKEEAPAAE